MKRTMNAVLCSATSLDELADLFISEQRKRGVIVVGLQWDIYHCEHVSNSHSSPLKGVSNWGGRQKAADGTPLPSSYPGWSGRLWIRYDRSTKKTHWGSDPFHGTPLHVGTGGGGAYSGPWQRIASEYHERHGWQPSSPDGFHKPDIYSWDFRMYTQDFPTIESQWEADKVWAILADNHVVSNHRFLWEDPETRQRDQEFISNHEFQKEVERAFDI